MLYEWDFGDPQSGNWATNGLSRNKAFGGVAAHVYERPGTYTVTLRVTDTDGGRTTVTRAIAVDDPDAFWAGKTACVSSSGDFSGCPATNSANRLTSSNFTSAMDDRVSQGYRRILFRRGETFIADRPWRTPNREKTEAMIAAFGTGEKPIVQIATSNTEAAIILQGTSVDTATAGAWRFVDFRVTSESPTNPAWGFKTSYIFDDVLLYKMDVGPTGLGFNFGPDQSGLNTPHKYYALVDTQLRGNTGTPVTDSGSCYFGGASHQFISGVVCGQANWWQMRIAYTHKAVISNIVVAEHAGAFEAIKFHCSLGPVDAAGLVCENMVFSDNLVAKEHVNLGTGSQENQAAIADSVFERNLLPFGISTIHPNDVFRFNVLGGLNIRPRQNRADAVEPRNNVFEQNVCDRRGTSISPSCVSIEAGTKVDGLILRNNLVYAQVASPPPLLQNHSGESGPVTEVGNVSTNVNPFAAANPNPLMKADFALPSGSSLIDHGVPVSFRSVDLLGNPAPSGMAVDVGAVEFQ